MQIVPFAPKAVANKKTNSIIASALANIASGGFPVVSIKGKTFTLVEDGNRTLITRPGSDEPASSLEVIVLNLNPHRSRVYYATGYVEGADDKPTCYSNNGKAPEADAQSPQAKSCAACVHSQYGSKITESGQKGFACANSQRLAIAGPANELKSMLLRVPGASLAALTEYMRELERANYDINEVVTKVGFDYSVAHPALTFKAVGVVPEEAMPLVRQEGETDIVQMIIGTKAMPAHEQNETPAPSDAVAALPARVSKPVAEDALNAVVAAGNAKKTTKSVKVEAAPAAEEAEPEPAPAPSKPAKSAPIVAESIDEGLDALLDGVDFDS